MRLLIVGHNLRVSLCRASRIRASAQRGLEESRSDPLRAPFPARRLAHLPDLHAQNHLVAPARPAACPAPSGRHCLINVFAAAAAAAAAAATTTTTTTATTTTTTTTTTVSAACALSRSHGTI